MHGKVLDSASHKNKLLLWNVFVKRLLDGWGRIYPLAAGRVFGAQLTREDVRAAQK